jgi:cbb3-type cytochrome oxidase subunit 3
MKSLTDVVSGAGLSAYAEIALILFVIAFLGVVVSLFLPSRQRVYERMRRLPIDRDAPLDSHYRSDGDSSLRRLRSSGQANRSE